MCPTLWSDDDSLRVLQFSFEISIQENARLTQTGCGVFRTPWEAQNEKKKIQTNDTTAISIHCTNYNRPLKYLVTSHTIIQYTPLHCPATARAAFNIAASSSNPPSTAIHPWLGLWPRYHMNLFPYFIKKINRSANCVVTLSKLTLSWNGHKYRNINMAY